MLHEFIRQLAAGRELGAAAVRAAVVQLVDAAVPAALKAEFLTALARKGESAAEIAAFAGELQSMSVPPPIDAATRHQEILDVVGTGGDRLGTFNISTTAALIAAAGGVRVAKHGNRSVTSQCGSADVLEALGVPIDLPPEAAARALRERHFAFFFAPNYHPAFRQVGPARKLCAERGQRTIFNFLGPLLNPARPSALLVGVSRPDLCEPLARVLQMLGVRRAMVVCGQARGGASPAHFDELSTLGPTHLAEFYQANALAASVLSPETFPLQSAALSDLVGGDRQANAEIVRRLVAGEERGPKRDAALLNAAAALFVGGAARSLGEGWELAAEIIDSGRARAKLTELAAT